MAIITTYGVLHGSAPREDKPVISVDLTAALRNPADDPSLIYMTGLDDKVRDHVLTTPGAGAVINDTVNQVLDTKQDVHVYCQGGRHRSVAIAESVATRLRHHGFAVEVRHRDIDKPVKRK